MSIYLDLLEKNSLKIFFEIARPNPNPALKLPYLYTTLVLINNTTRNILTTTTKILNLKKWLSVLPLLVSIFSFFFQLPTDTSHFR